MHEATTGPRPCSCTHGPDNACIVTRTGNCISAALWRTSVAVLLVNSSPAQPAPPAGPEVRPESARRRKNPARPCQSKSYVGEFEQRQLFWYVVMVSLSSTGTLLEYHPYMTRKLPLTVGLPDSFNCSSTMLLSRARCALPQCQAAPPT